MTSTPVNVVGADTAMTAGADALPASLGAHLRVQPAPFVPELRLYLAEQLVPLWQATELLAGERQPPPFWAFAWPGSLALARYLLDTPGLVAGKRVLDFGSGGGLAAIAAAHCGAAHVLAVDLDPHAVTIQRMNAELNGVRFDSACENVLDRDAAPDADLHRDAVGDIDVIMAGDVCYEREPAGHITDWLRRQADTGADVLLADPGRTYAPSERLHLLATYDIPTLHDLESVGEKRTHLWRVLAQKVGDEVGSRGGS